MKSLIVILMLSLFSQVEYSKSLDRKIKHAIVRSFETEHIQSDHIPLQLKHERPEPGLELFKLSMHKESVGYMVVTTTKGRYDYFDYCVIYNNDFTIRDIFILTYRSDHGYEITNKAWLSQFKGKPGCDLEYGHGIDGLSGATLSASSLTGDIKYLCLLLRSLPGNNDL